MPSHILSKEKFWMECLQIAMVHPNCSTIRLFEMESGSQSSFHSHNWEHEIYILKGECIVVSGKNERRFEVGDAFFIPPDEGHQFKNNGKETLKFLSIVPSHTYFDIGEPSGLIYEQNAETLCSQKRTDL